MAAAATGPAVRLQQRLAGPAATRRLGAALARLAAAGDVIALTGDLGAGKTELARAFIRYRLGAATEVPSPTFTLVQHYPDPALADGGMIQHVDLYRLAGPEEVEMLGIEDGVRDGITLIEWPDRMGSRQPGNHLEIHLRITDKSGDGEARMAVLTGTGSWRERLRAGRFTAES